jgi:hypothetical protein
LSSLSFLPLWIALPLLAGSDSRFAQLRSSSETLGSLGAFLEKYVGDCPTGSAPQCRSTASAFRSRSNKTRFFMLLTDEAAGTLSAGRFDSSRGEYELRLTPFFAAGRYALTHGAPRQTDAAGNPLLPLLTMRGKAPEYWDASRLQRLIAGRELRVELVFTPREVWTLARRRGETIRGVKSRIDAVQVTNGRTGEVIGSWP